MTSVTTGTSSPSPRSQTVVPPPQQSSTTSTAGSASTSSTSTPSSARPRKASSRARRQQLTVSTSASNAHYGKGLATAPVTVMKQSPMSPTVGNTTTTNGSRRPNTTIRRSSGLLNLQQASAGDTADPTPASASDDSRNGLKRPLSSGSARDVGGSTRSAPASARDIPSSGTPTPHHHHHHSSSHSGTSHSSSPVTVSRTDGNGSPPAHNHHHHHHSHQSAAFVFPKPRPVSQVQEQLRQQSSFLSSPGISPAGAHTSKLRKMSSADNFFSHNSKSSTPTTATSYLFHNLSQDDSVSGDNSPFSPQPPPKQDYNTPDNYRSVKPLQTAFMSTGLLSKRNRMNSGAAGHSSLNGSVSANTSFDSMRGPPDTPCKKPMATSTPSRQLGDSGAGPNHGGMAGTEIMGEPSSPFPHAGGIISTHHTHTRSLSHQEPFLPHNPSSLSTMVSLNTMSPASTPMGSDSSVRSNLGLRDTRLKFGTNSGGAAPASRMQSYPDVSDDDEDMGDDDCNSLPATPTKDNSNHSLTGLGLSQVQPLNIPNASRQTSQATVRGSGGGGGGGDSGGRATKQSSVATVTGAEIRTPQPIRWADSSSGAHSRTSSDSSMTSPRTPDFLHSDSANVASSSLESQSGDSTRRSIVRATPSSSKSKASISPENGAKFQRPTTPARTPKTPVDVEFNSFSASFGSVSQDELLDPFLTDRFEKVSILGRGEFSTVFAVSPRVTGPTTKYAVKRTKYPFMSQRARRRRMEEVDILRQLSSRDGDDGKEYIINLFDTWEGNGHLYIMTEYCENGNLDTFVSEQGNISRIDEWRVWKIMAELALGVRFIHDNGFLHLDLKPANVFITFEGTLKIGDFGMATPFPAAKGIEREGDREYIAPEVLSSQQYDKPADIFSLGLMMLEIAANIVLPDNGVHWQKLRSGDLSEAGRLSSGDLHAEEYEDLDIDSHGLGSSELLNSPSRRPPSDSTTSGTSVRSRLGHGGSMAPTWAPKFMVDNSGALDGMVKWMLDPNPKRRPSANEILSSDEIAWVGRRRKAGAVIYEGDYGPEPELGSDSELMQVEDDDIIWR